MNLYCRHYKDWEHGLDKRKNCCVKSKDQGTKCEFSYQSKTVHLKQATGCVGATATHPRHKGDDVVFLVFDGIFGVLLFTLLRAAEPNCPCLQLLLPPTYMSQTVTAAYKRRCQYD